MNDEPELPQCPFCSNNLKPERLTASRWVCLCCSRVWLEHPPVPKAKE